MATLNTMLIGNRWKSTKKVFLISMNTSEHENLYFTNEIPKVCSRRVIQKFKGKTTLLMLKRNNKQSENGINWTLGRKNQTLTTISPVSDTIHYNPQDTSKISETTSTSPLNIDDDKSHTAPPLEVKKALSPQVIRSLPNILRPRSAKLKYKAQNSENAQNLEYQVPENIQYNWDVRKHMSREACQDTSTVVKKVYTKKPQNKRKQVHKPFSIKEESPKWISENERSEETELKEIFDEEISISKKVNATATFASCDTNKLRINEVKEGQTIMANQSLDYMLKSEIYTEEEFHSRTNMIHQGNIETQDFRCTSNQNEINGIQSELCIPNYTDFLGIGNHFTDSDEIHKLLHPTLDDYTNNTDSTNNDTSDLDLLIRKDCAEERIGTVSKLLPESVTISNDIFGRKKANNVIKETEKLEKIELLGKSKAQNESKLECNNNIENISNLHVYENLDPQVTTYKIPDNDVSDLTYALVNNSATIQEPPDNLINESGFFLNHKNSQKKKNKMTTKQTSIVKRNRNKCGNVSACSTTNCTEHLDNVCSHEFKVRGVYYAEENTFTNHLNCYKNLITTYNSLSCEEMYKRKADKTKHIKTLHEAEILPKEPPASLRCPSCSKIYSKAGSLKKHMELHQNFRLTCKWCSKTFREKVDFTRHVDRRCHNVNTL